MKRRAVIGVGNNLMGDEGVGIHAIEHLRNYPLHDVDLIDGGTAGAALLHIFERYDHIIIIDAADFGEKAGEIKKVAVGAVLTADSPQISLHGVGLAGILELAKRLEYKLPQITIIAVQPEKIAPSMALSKRCQNAIPRIADVICRLLSS